MLKDVNMYLKTNDTQNQYFFYYNEPTILANEIENSMYPVTNIKDIMAQNSIVQGLKLCTEKT